MRRILAVAALGLLAACSGGGDAPTSTTTPPSTTPPAGGGTTTPTPSVPADPPALTREFRGLWVATVANIDWPSATTLNIGQSQAEMRAILDKAQALRMNAVVVQVRAAGDALYRSNIEPFSRVLTGTQGQDPGWDPLNDWVTEAHARGLELHAWFNPFRAGNISDTLRLAANHLAKRRPDLSRIAQGQLWFDPGEPEVQQQTLDVITDVLQRYDIDGVHLDDYFYPYPVTGAAIPIQFPDDSSYAKYLRNGGTAMARDDWRRRNVDTFIQALYTKAHQVKPQVKVGLSPFGIWQPGNPTGITGLNAYTDIFADSKKWLNNGWLDYFAPQLYWSLASTGQSFTGLLDWWIAQNTQKRHVWPGLAAYRVADGTSSQFAASEIVNQITATKVRAGANAGGAFGTLLYNTTTVRTNKGGLADALAAQSFSTDALVPASPWLDGTAPTSPSVSVTAQTGAMRAAWTPQGAESARWWVVQWHTGGGAWLSRVVPAATRTVDLTFTGTSDKADVVAVGALDAAMNLSTLAVWRATR